MDVKEKLKNLLLNNGFQITMAIVTLFITVFNLYAASKLAPLVSRISVLEIRAADDDKRNDEVNPLIERFYVTETSVKQMQEDIKYIRDRIDKVFEKL